MRHTVSSALLAALLLTFVPTVGTAQETAGGSDGEVPVTIKEVDVREAIQEFRKFETKLEQYRVAVSEGQKAAEEIESMLTELRKTASAENDFNEGEILAAIQSYVDGVVARQSDLVDFLQSQRYRISYYANKVAATVRPENISVLFGTRESNLRRLRGRKITQQNAAREVATFIDKLSPREFSRTSFQPLPGLSPQKRRALHQLELRFQNSKNAVKLAESRLWLVGQAARVTGRATGGPTVNVDLILSQMFAAVDRIRLQMSSDLLYLEAYLARFEESARTEEIVRALQQLISLQGGLEGPSPGLAGVLDWLEESTVRKLTLDDSEIEGQPFARSSDLLREAYSTGRGGAPADGGSK